ncbi:WD40 repeat-containing protein [Phytophthora cinnamomi]|uniref:WD40 repeat-containing protein n=1 Tax=Phytophthora cinnamomi TaxID=4785 RepID=UPI003559400D|nr:WD40 repeat-containing protein [Phytophthora cinnamomi]
MKDVVAAATAGTSSMDAQMYMQMQPDWETAADSCWLDVYERTVRIAATAGQELAQDEPPKAEVHSSPSCQFQLTLTAPSTASEAAHLVQILDRDDAWIDVQVDVKTPEASTRTLRTVFQAPNETVDVPAVDASDAPGAPPPALLQLHSVDVSNDERFVVVGGSDGVCMLWDSLNRAQMLPLKGHVADVTSARFFPSSQVVLTGSLDFTLRIWSISGRCAAVLTGHRGGVEDIAIVGRGRNVLSCGTDGLIQLWNCGTQDVIAKWANDDQSVVHCLSVMDDTAQLLADGNYPPYTTENEAETDGKVLFAGLDNGETLGVDIRARGAVLNVDALAGSIISCAATTANASLPMLFTGSEDGLLTVWDLRHTGMPLHTLSRSSSPIHSIAVSASSADDPASTGSVWTAHGDGACCNWSNLGEKPHVSTELTGPQYDAVRGVAIASQTGRIFSACRDGRLREYIPHVVA